MLSLRRKLSPRQKFWLGFAWCPLVSWTAFVGQFVLPTMVGRIFPKLAPSNQFLAYVLISWLACWAAVALTCGFGAAFFWSDPIPDRETQGKPIFWSNALAWAPFLLSSFSAGFFFFALWIFLLLPFSIFVALYCGSLERGIRFWNSNSPREWVGDFSNPDLPEV